MARNLTPRHIGFIPDGNRRWAMDRGLPKEDGYACGIGPGLSLYEICKERGIVEASIYCFTQDNTKRPSSQKLAFTDVPEICADKIDLFTANRWTGFELILGLVVFSRPGADDLVFESLGLLLVQDLLGIRHERPTLLEVLARLDGQAEVLRAMAPVEDMRLLGRVVPLDERLAAPGPLEGQCIGSTRRSGHDVGLSCKVWT